MSSISTLNSADRSMRCSLTCALFMVTAFFTCAVTTSGLRADEPKFKVGDIVKFEFLGDELQGEVTAVLGTGWPRISFEYRERERNQPFPPHQVTLIKKEADAGDKGGSMKLATEMRTWKDATGSFEIEAELVGKEGESLKLKSSKGQSITVPIAKLSKEDQDFVAMLLADAESEEANPFAVDAEGPMQKADVKKADVEKADDSPKQTELQAPIGPDESAARTIVVGEGDGGDWGIEPDSVESEQAPQWLSEIKSISFPESTFREPFHNRSGDLLIAADRGVAAMSATNAFNQYTEVNMVDLVDASKKVQFRIPYKDEKAVAVSPAGTTLISLKAARGAIRGQLEFWSTNFDSADSVATNSKTWPLADFAGKGGVIASRAEFVSDKLLLTVGKKVSLWDTETDSAIYSASWPVEPKIRLSHHRKYLAFFYGGTIGILNLADGKVLGTAKTEAKTINSLAFSPSGEYLAGIGASSIYVWSLSDGRVIREMSLSQISSRLAQLEWPDEQHLLVNGGKLVNISLRVVVWDYNVANAFDSIAQIAGTQFFHSGKQGEHVQLTPVTIPHKPMDELMVDLNADDLLVLKPGTAVSVDIDLPLAPDEQKKVRDSVSSQLEAAGVVVESGAEIVLRMSVEKGEQKTISLRSIGGRFGRRGSEDVNYTPTTSRVELLIGKQVLWSQVANNVPGRLIRSSADETAQDVIKRQCQPRPEFFASVVLPKFLARLPGGKASLGSSTVSASGLR